ncbi:MAG: hypothetical protein A3B74_01035 [Candidatus Kerfeldbacteria bacterium RIFCSPHIGHO2_02_FULL_42_14]|uniref:Uncharacterized protein n=1 Tax=Candidatus Kerfeldbacteria bacterium RIFCSPHIGHO2_02_FULL_42_14 TaxID=1798540 RepID=A0A1G2ATU8_9BACT|nr:MAG: hypothetical protein A3B74_01035 [Candidatus Kerfeldbacteria bacterium RIFCSPHIGHO2_02_FULL_42_14]OGY81935.1 MAG: hypothetical protein A3E60_01115 [Candidatus Kerfeldbacteria bacterium RIFCSPHIGHO2_12_FULL_42_13]OGY83430.1 MAG: hypothetical protein A3I91_02140 [Candidatus Kerfeldbacteria bacterium RIFCSPLOWO2_02_FULL_42_19]OGY85560.1 MAG: hypothetical protein A3G01_03680 [Candidatus Kerfeldbacteria bacterium RIFCSPLOWO2_12_FULL_43_9]
MFLSPRNGGQTIDLSRVVEVDGVQFSPRDGWTQTCVQIRNHASPFTVKLQAADGKERSLPISTCKIAGIGTVIRIGNQQYLING